MAQAIKRETFAALRARREGHRIASEILHPELSLERPHEPHRLYEWPEPAVEYEPIPSEPELIAIDPSPTPREVVKTVAWALVLVVLALALALSLILYISMNTPPLKP